MTDDSFPHLAPELRRLSGDALRLWGDPAARREALLAIVEAWEAGSPVLQSAIRRVDGAVEDGLAALGLPRGPVSDVRIEGMRPGLYGQKLRDCTIILVADYLRAFLRERAQADRVFRTWLHESLHARQPYASNAAAEYRVFRGYEEGLVEGLTQVVLTAAGITVADVPFGAYVAAYGALARAAGIESEALLRALWRHPAGDVRQNLATVVSRLREQVTGASITPEAHGRMRALGDSLFATDRAGHAPDPAALVALWRRAFA